MKYYKKYLASYKKSIIITIVIRNGRRIWKKNYGIYLKIQINNFYGGRYNKRILEKPEVYFRAGDSGYKKELVIPGKK